MSLRFDATTDRLYRTADLPAQTAFTICGWARRTSHGSAYRSICGMSNVTSSPNIAYEIGWNASGVLVASAYHGSGDQSAAAPTNYTDGDWFFFAIQPRMSDRALVAYFGSLGGLPLEQAIADPSIDMPTFTPAIVWYGNNGWGEGAAFCLSAPRIFDRILTVEELEAERLALSPSSQASPNIASTLAGGDLTDLTGNGREWTIAGTLDAADDPPSIPVQLRRDVAWIWAILGDQAITVNDSGSGTDVLAAISAGLSVSDSGAGADSFGSMSASAALSDAGSGVDSVALSAALQVVDALTGADALGPITVSLALADSASGADQPVITVSLSVADSGSGADAVSVLTEILKSIADSGAGSDSVGAVAVTLGVAETGSGADATAISVALTVSDSGSGVDLVSVITETLKTIADSGVGLDAISSLTVAANVTDSGQGEDSQGISVNLTVADSATGADVINILQAILKSVADSGSGSDALSVSVSVPISDGGAGTDLIAQVMAALALADSGVGVEVVIRTIAGATPIRQVTFVLKQRRASFTFSAPTITKTLN